MKRSNRVRGLLLVLGAALTSMCSSLEYDDGYLERRIEALDGILATLGPESRKELDAGKTSLLADFQKLPQGEQRQAALNRLCDRAHAMIEQAKKLQQMEATARKVVRAALIKERQQKFIGHWKGKDMLLEISESGAVKYERGAEGGMKKSVTAGITDFQEDHFKVGLMGITTTFRIDKPPAETDHGWKMTIDGVELTRVGGAPIRFGTELCTKVIDEQCVKPRTVFDTAMDRIHVIHVTKDLPAGARGFNIAWLTEDVGDVAPPNHEIANASGAIPLDAATAAHFTITGSLSKPTVGWPPGKYRVEIKIDDKLIKTERFTIEAAPQATAKLKTKR